MVKKARINKALDRDLKTRTFFEKAQIETKKQYWAPSLGLVFIIFTGLSVSIFFGFESKSIIIMAAAAIGAYMALNIGANDVANNVGPAVGSKALSMFGALLIAAVFECAGALIAGGDVIGTISKGIIDPSFISDSSIFVLAMFAALISAAIWINLATVIGAPVSTTHSIVGGVLGAGLIAAGTEAVNWYKMSQIAASWVISPVLGAIIAALFLWFIKTMVSDQKDKIKSARRWVPLLIAIMAGAFSTYLCLKGLKKVIRMDMQFAGLIGILVLISCYFIVISLYFIISDDIS